MKFNYKKILFSVVILSMSFASFAQFPGDPPTDPDPPAPIDSNLVWLAILGIAFAYYQFVATRKKV